MKLPNLMNKNGSTPADVAVATETAIKKGW